VVDIKKRVLVDSKNRNNAVQDLRKFSKQTIRRLIFGTILILIVVGIGLILLIYGKNAAITGLLCVAGMLLPILLIVFVFYIIDLIIKQSNRSSH
jgi:fatty acid desaturase